MGFIVITSYCKISSTPILSGPWELLSACPGTSQPQSTHRTVVEIWLNGNLSHNQQRIYIYRYLVDGFNLWKIWKSDWIIIPSIWKNKTYSKPPTRIYIYMALLNGILRDYSQNIYFLVLNKCTFTLFIMGKSSVAMFIHFLLKWAMHISRNDNHDETQVVIITYKECQRIMMTIMRVLIQTFFHIQS